MSHLKRLICIQVVTVLQQVKLNQVKLNKRDDHIRLNIKTCQINTND